MPLLRALNAHFFEPGDPNNNDFWKVDAGDEKYWRAAGLAATDTPPATGASPKFHYPGEVTRRMLADTAPGADGARTLRYVNPATGGAVMPILDCYAMRLDKGKAAPNVAPIARCALWCRGNGRSTIGDKTFEWSPQDVFTIPSWSWASHQAYRRRRRSLHRVGQGGLRTARRAARRDAVAAHGRSCIRRRDLTGEGPS